MKITKNDEVIYKLLLMKLMKNSFFDEKSENVEERIKIDFLIKLLFPEDFSEDFENNDCG